MKKKIIAPGKIELGGETYDVVFDFEAIAEAEDQTDRALLTGLTRHQVNHPTINFVRAMFYAGLRRFHPELTYPQVAALVSRENLMALWSDLLSAWVDSRQQELGDKEPDPTQAPRPQEFPTRETL